MSSTSPSASSDLPTPPEQAAPRARLTGGALASVLTSLLLTLFLAALDQTIVNTALPTILRDLNGYDRLSWPIISYLLTSTTMIPIVGKLSDQFGRKWFLIVGVVIFLLGSALSGASQEIASLFNGDAMNYFIVFRGLQGIGGGALFSLVFTTIGDIFPPAERARWQGLFSGVFGLASVVGPTAGGYITDSWGWQWIFYVNLPLGAIALVLLFRYLPNNLSIRTTVATGWAGVRRIDVFGGLAAAGATVCLVLGLNWGGQRPPYGYPWNSPEVITVLVLAGVLLVAFVLIERFVAVEPILPLDLFQNRIFTAGAILALFVGMALFAMALYLPLFIQVVLGESATNSGTAITPLTLSLAIGAAIIGQVIARLGRYQIIAILGSVVLAFGVFLMAQMDATTPVLTVVRNMIVVGLGLGMLQPVLTLAAQNAIPRRRLGAGTGAVTYLRSIGQLLGVAIVGAVANNTFSSELNAHLPAGIRRLSPQAQSALTDQNTLQRVLSSRALQQQTVAQALQQADKQTVPGAVAQAVQQATANVPPGPNHDQTVAAITQQVTEQVTAQIHAAVTATLNQLFVVAKDALALGIQHAFWVAFGITLLIFITTFFLKDVPLATRQSEVPERRAPESAPPTGDESAPAPAHLGI